MRKTHRVVCRPCGSHVKVWGAGRTEVCRDGKPLIPLSLRVFFLTLYNVMEMRIYYLLGHSHVLHSASDDRQDGPTGPGCYQLANDGADVEARQGWDQVREDLSTAAAAYRSGDHVSGAQIVVLE